jgi:hypothetical protein
MAARRELWIGVLVSVVLTFLVLRPAFLDPRQDSFPLSTFPMFSRPKPDAGLVLTQVLAVLPDGSRQPLPPKLATGNEEVIQTLRMIRDQVYSGKKRAAVFCEDVAARVRESSNEPWSKAVAIEVARSHFDTVEYFETGPKPITRKVLVRCPTR